MADRISLDYESVGKHLNAIVDASDGIQKTIQDAAKKIEDFNSSTPIKDKTVAAVADKLAIINESLGNVPAQLEDFNQSLKQKSEGLQEATDEAMRGIMNA